MVYVDIVCVGRETKHALLSMSPAQPQTISELSCLLSRLQAARYNINKCAPYK